MLQIPEHPFRAFIFDCDGTLVDSMPLHFIAWTQSLRAHDAPFDFTEEFFYSTAGVREHDMVRRLNDMHGCALDPDGVAETKAEIFIKLVPQVPVVCPVADFARSLHGRAPMAVASGSEEPIVRACLEANELILLFETIITPRDVAKGKPAPDMFLLAAERLAVPPEDCLVLEDGMAGVEAAKAAGMQWVFIPRTLR